MCAHQSSDLTNLSKSLAWILRHGARQLGLNLDSGGYLYVDEILKQGKFQSYSEDDVIKVVKNDSKLRFQTRRGTQSRLMIRATQGHTLQVNNEELLHPITRAEQVPTVVHGTSRRAWQNIKTEGLKTMRRTHIHFAIGLPGQSGVLSGMNASSEIRIYLDVKKALADGMKLFRSENDVILSEGLGGVISPIYFKKVVDRNGSDVLGIEHGLQNMALY